MRKGVILHCLVLTLTLLLAAGTVALADGGVSGNWSGTWNCPEGQIKSGKMHGNLTQNGNKVEGHFWLEGTIVGNIDGPLNGNISGSLMVGDINAGGKKIHLDGTVSGNTISGNYSSEIGNGGFKINRQ